MRSPSAGTGSTRNRVADPSPDQWRVHLQRPGHWPVDGHFMLGVAERRIPAGAIRLRLRQRRLLWRLRARRRRIRPNLMVNAGPRPGTVHPLAQHLQLGAATSIRRGSMRAPRARCIRRRGRACRSPAMMGIRAEARPVDGAVRSAARRDLDAGRRRQYQLRAAGASCTRRRTCSSTRASRTTRHGARRSPIESPGRPGRSGLGLSRSAIPSRPSMTNWATHAFPAFGVYVNAPMDINPTALQQWNLSAQSVSLATGCCP